jgi:maltooligosyltrehalose trehalohydrolase
MDIASHRRRLTAGVEVQPDRSALVRVWAPACRRVDVVFEVGDDERRIVPLGAEENGYFSATVDDVRPGDRYWFRLDGDQLRPDPVSRFQPEGPHGPSMIVDPRAFRWTDDEWAGVSAVGQVLYELHVGTFTPEGTWAAAAEQLPELARVGVTVIEMMPVADFAGSFGWGYDGVNLYAPSRLYGTPDDLRSFVDRAHACGLGVILDVVYNHLGPDGNYLHEFSPDYFTDRYKNDWGAALNFEGSSAAREFFVENAGYWIEEFHFDGLRLDATQDVKDASQEHVISSIVARARAAAGHRSVYIVAENEPQDPKLLRPHTAGGFGVDAVWNDDYQHAAVVALTGRREAYYTDYFGSPQEFVSAAKYGYLYQGQWYGWQKQRRGGSSLGVPAHAYIVFLENHDQIANTALGRRMHQLSSPARYRALTALTLLGPATPLLFQGQEFAASSPFLFFADHHDQLHDGVREGRRQFLAQFPSTLDPSAQRALSDPIDRRTFLRCKLDLHERERHREAYALHRDLLALRRSDACLSAEDCTRVDGAAIAAHAFILRFSVGDADARLLIVNLGIELDLASVPEPLLAPPEGCRWTIEWASDDVRYGGCGTAPLRLEPVHLAAEVAIFLRPEPDPDSDDDDD